MPVEADIRGGIKMVDDQDDDAGSPEDIDHAEITGSGEVYFLSLVDPSRPDFDFGLVKIGTTKGDVEKRIAQLQTGNPYRLRCEGRFSSPVAGHVEHWLHRSNATQGYQLEWLKRLRSEIPVLIEAGKQESDKFARIAEAMTYWSHRESNGKTRPPTAQERRLHDLAREVVPNLRLARARLKNTRLSIGLKAGMVRRIPGIVKVSQLSPKPSFNGKIALERFKALAAAHLVWDVKGPFFWRSMRDDHSAMGICLRKEYGHRKKNECELNELDAAILDDWDGTRQEDPRTNDLIALHDKFLKLVEQCTRLSLDVQDIRAQLIETIEDFETITGVCHYARSRKCHVDSESFFKAHEEAHAKCCLAKKAYIRRDIFLSRSY